jgi:hypothetical protein
MENLVRQRQLRLPLRDWLSVLMFRGPFCSENGCFFRLSLAQHIESHAMIRSYTMQADGIAVFGSGICLIFNSIPRNPILTEIPPIAGGQMP